MQVSLNADLAILLKTEHRCPDEEELDELWPDLSRHEKIVRAANVHQRADITMDLFSVFMKKRAQREAEFEKKQNE